jgi:hypothetical protein
MKRSLRALGALCAIALASACAGPSNSAAGFVSNTGALPARGSVPTHLPSELLFVPTENGTIDIYSLKRPNQSGVIARITGLTASQQEMTVDANNDLFVVNNGGSANDDYVSEYVPPYTGAPTILNTVWKNEIFYPIGVAVDANGTVYVSGCGTYCFEQAAVYVYPGGATSPARAIKSARFNSLGGLAVDAHGTLYVFNWNDATFGSDVFQIAPGSKSPKPMHLHGLDTGNGGNGVSLDAAGDLYVGGISSGSNYILEFKPGARNAFRVIDSMPFTDSPGMLDVGPDGNLYVPIACPFPPCTSVYGFRPRGRNPFESIGSSPYAATTILGVATAPNLQLEGSKR